DGGDARAAIALAYFRKLYDIERTCKGRDATPEERKAIRGECSLPVLDELYRWIEQIKPQLVPGSRLHQAATYATTQRQYFERGSSAGRLELDDGEAERQVRPSTVGEKN